MTTAIILAAGLGTRMRSALPKAAHPIAGRPMLRHLIAACEPVFDRIAVVVGPGMSELERLAAPHPTVVQTERLGTGHAARTAEAFFDEDEVAVLFADNPLIESATLARLLAARRKAGAGLALMAMRPRDPARYGRIVGTASDVERIVEYNDASEAERAIGLCNAGALCGEGPKLRAWLGRIRNDNAKGEFYLTDLVALARGDGERVVACEADEEELRGINSRAELAAAEAVVQRRLRLQAMEAGATLIAPETVFFAADTAIAPDVTIHPHVVIGPGVSIGSGAEIKSFSHLDGCRIGEGAVIGPHARLRPGTAVGRGAHVGNFVELKNTALGDGAKANHLAYLGDAAIGARANIGAGTITCNYDGFAKHRTEIGEDVFVGSDAVLVAPVRLGNGSFVAAGSVITEDVPEDAMGFGRARQATLAGKAAAYRRFKSGAS